MRHMMCTVIAASLAACATTVDDDEDATFAELDVCPADVVEDLEQVELAASAPLPPDNDVPVDVANPELAPADCACVDSRCVAEAIQEHLGCGACATMTCAGESIGACVPCENALAEEAEACAMPSQEVAR